MQTFISTTKKIKEGTAPSTGKRWVLSECFDDKGTKYSTFLNLSGGNFYEVEVQDGKYGPQIVKARQANPQTAKTDAPNDFDAVFEQLRRIEDMLVDIKRDLSQRP